MDALQYFFKIGNWRAPAAGAMGEIMEHRKVPPLMALIAGLKMMQVGDEAEILSTDKGSAKGIPKWVKKVGHALVDTAETRPSSI